MTYQTDSQEREAAEQAAAREQNNAAAWETVLRTFPLDRPGEAHYRMLLDYCQNEITLEKVSRFFANPPKGWSLPLISLDRRREQIIDEICDLERDPKGRRMSDYDCRMSRIKYTSTYSLGQLRARYVELRLKQEWAKKSPDDIRVELAAIRASTSNVWRDPADGRVYEKLPTTLEGLPAGDFLKYAAKHEFPKFRRVVERYGAPQVTAALKQ
jgi:hypothetical protein